MTTSREQVRAVISRNMAGSNPPPEAIEAFELGAKRMAQKHATQHARDIMNSARTGKPEEKNAEHNDGAKLGDLEQRIASLENRSAGTKTAPMSAKTLDAPAIISRGMHRDQEPLNWAGYIRGQLSKNWTGARREEEIYNATMTTTGDGSGMIPTIIGNEIWFDLLGVNVLGQAGVPVITLENGAVSIPSEDTAPSAAWVAEGADISDSGGAFGTAGLSPHKIAFLREVSNEMLLDAPAAADQYIRQALLNALSRGLNEGFLNGTGASNQPQGLMTGSPAYAVDETGNTLTIDKLVGAYYDIVGAGGNPGSVRAIMAPDAAKYLDALRASTDGEYLRASQPVEIPQVVTDSVSVTSATPDSTSILLGDFSQSVGMYAFGPARLDVDTSVAFGRDAITFRLVQRVDIGVRYPSLMTRLDAVNLG